MFLQKASHALVHRAQKAGNGEKNLVSKNNILAEALTRPIVAGGFLQSE